MIYNLFNAHVTFYRTVKSEVTSQTGIFEIHVLVIQLNVH